MKNKPIIIVIALLAVQIALAVWLALSFINSNKNRNFMTSYNGIVETLSKVDSLMIGYHETGHTTITLDNPTVMHIDAKNRLFLASGKTINELDTSGVVVKTIPFESVITSFVTDDAGTFYCTSDDQIIIADSSGTKKTVFKIGDGHSMLVSIAIGGDQLFAGDAGMKTVWHLTTKGTIVNRIAEKDSIRGIDGLIISSMYVDLAIGQGGSLWVANTGRHRLENYRQNGDLISSWGEAGTGLKEFCGCCNPAHFALLPDGRFVTSEKGILRVKVYDQAGNFESVVAPSFKGDSPLNIAIDSFGTIFILDRHEKAIRQFKKNT